MSNTKQNEKPNKKALPKGSMKVLGRVIGDMVKSYPIRFAIVILSIIVASIGNVIIIASMQTLIDEHISPLLEMAVPDFSGLLMFIATLAVTGIAVSALSYLYTRLMIVISQGMLKKLRDDMFEHMQTLPIRYFDQNTVGDIMSLYTNDTDTMRQMLSQTIPQTISASISIITSVVTMLVLDRILTLFVLVFVALMMIIIAKIGGNSGKYFAKSQKSLGEVNGFIEEMINGQKVVKVFCHEEEAEKQFDVINEELNDNTYRANMYANILMPIMNNLGHLMYVLIAIIGGAVSIYGIAPISIGTIAVFLQLSNGFTQQVAGVSQQLNSVVMAAAGAGRIFKLIDEQQETDDGYVTLVNVEQENGEIKEVSEHTGMWAWKHPHKADQTVTYTPLTGNVKLDSVDFGYTEEKIVLHDVTIDANPGQKIAFVGATGAGKTTITNLINRFYDIADGKIRYDGININKIKKSDLRRSLGIVLQETNLFTGTVKDNIRYGNLAASDEDVIKAAKLANAHDFITRLPNGYDTELDGSGDNLSQGQRQLIAIARAAIADPPVMILDEATSSIDTRTEQLVQKGMDSLMKGRTVFVIAHRLSTVQNSEMIMVLELGRIIEQGTHQELINQKGKYYQLYTGAFELE